MLGLHVCMASRVPWGARNISNDAARQYVDHTCNDRQDSTLEYYNDYDIGYQDSRHHCSVPWEDLESGALGNRIRELLDSSAINRRNQHPFAEEDEYVSSHWHLTTRIRRSFSL